MVPQKIIVCDSLPVSSSGKNRPYKHSERWHRNSQNRNRRQMICRQRCPHSESCVNCPAIRTWGQPIISSRRVGTASMRWLSLHGAGMSLVLSISLREFFATPTAEAIHGTGGKQSDYHALRHTTEQRNIPQTSGQKQIWLASQESGSAYNNDRNVPSRGRIRYRASGTIIFGADPPS